MDNIKSGMVVYNFFEHSDKLLLHIDEALQSLAEGEIS